MFYKHSMESILNFSSSPRWGKFYGKRNIYTPKSPLSRQTIAKLKVGTKGVKTCVYYKLHNLIEEFSTIKNAAKYVGLYPCSVSKYIKKVKKYLF